VAFVSLYRKYRSQAFKDLIGQDHVVRTLQNGITSARFSHAYLFTGPRGTGKTSAARLLAKALCCEKGPLAEPCNECDVCRGITEGSFIDVVEMDAASQTGVDDVREKIIQVVDYLPAVARYKVFIIDEVHDLSAKAFDALLKTIEEPPAHMIFVLATTEYSKVPPTIRSRCQKFEFHRATLQDLVKQLEHVASAEKVKVDRPALEAIARMADGGFRDALTLLEQAIISSSGNKITLQDVYDQLGLITEDATDRMLEAIASGNVKDLIAQLGEQTRVGRDSGAILESLMFRLADLTRIAYGVEQGTDASRQAAGHDLAIRIGQARLIAIRSALAEAHKVIRDITLPRLWLEAELVRISQFSEPSTKPKADTRASDKAQAGEAAPAQKAAPAGNGRSADSDHAAAAVEERKSSGKSDSPKPVKPEPTGDKELDKAGSVWFKVLSNLPEDTAIYLKLVGSSVAAFKSGTLTIEIPRKVDLAWIQDKEKPGRQAMILKELHAHGGDNWKIQFKGGNGSPRANQIEAVELPAEGPKLAKIAKDVFGSSS